MGGYFSTRWSSARTRQDTDPLLSLDIRWLRKLGALTPGAIASPTWTCRGEPSGDIVTIMSHDGATITLNYRTRSPGEEWHSIKEVVWLDTTPCNYGGGRSWFLCPGCGSRRAVLFSVGGRFRCRGCHDLAYSSTREDAMERSIRRCAELRRKIGGGHEQPVWTIPGKPDGMTNRAYWRVVQRLTREIRRTEGFLEDEFVRRCGGLGKH